MKPPQHAVLSALGRRTGEPPISWLMSVALSRPGLVSLAAGFTDNESLPVPQAREILDELLSAPQTGRAALQYGTTAGEPELRRLTAARLLRLAGKPAAAGKTAALAERILITNGSQQLLYMVTEALCDPGDIVLLEDPTYFVYLGIAQSHGLQCRGLRMDADGIDLAHLESVLEELKKTGALRRVKMLYLVAYFQNPGGVTTAYGRKAAALALLRRYEKAAGHPIYLLEDAAYRELRFTGKDVPSVLAAPGAERRVIYAGTYSKPFATGARIGFGLLPEPLSDAVRRIKGNHDFGSANLLQQLLRRVLASGAYEKHLVTLQARYARKAAVMQEAMRRHMPAGVTWADPLGGLYFWVSLPRRVRTGMKSKLFQTALAEGVFYVPGELCYADDPARPKPAHQMRLSFGGATEDNIRLGIERLGKAVRAVI